MMELSKGLMDGQETQCGIWEGLPPGSTAQLKTELTKKRQKGVLGSRGTGGEYMEQKGRPSCRA